MTSLARLLAPRSVAVIGASADVSKTSGKPIHFLLKHGFRGEIFPVNPKGGVLAGLRCYASIAELPHAPDVGLVLLGAARAHEAVRELAKIGTAAAVVVASGYGETGSEGAYRQAELLQAAGPMRLLGPNTIGLVNLTEQIPLSVSGALEMDHFPEGAIAVVSQSGGILGSLLSRAAGRGIGLSKLISTSNEADLELADFVEHLADDPATQVIALYIEAIRNPEKFRAAALKAARCGKPIVAYKIGRSEAGAKAAASHTGALAGSDQAYNAFFRQTEVIRAETFADLLDIPLALSSGRHLHGNRIAILTSSGGAGTLVSDNLGGQGFETPQPDQPTAERLRALLPGEQAVLDRNPIDVTLAGLQPKVLREAITALLDSPTYDGLAIIVGSSGVASPDLMADAVSACLPGRQKPIVAYVSPHAPAAAALLTSRGVPAFAAPESCAAAFDGMRRAAAFEAAIATSSPAGAGPAVECQGDLPVGILDEAQSKALFAQYGIPCVRERIVTSPSEAETAAAELGGTVVLKILSQELTHKSDAGGVLIGATAQTIAGDMERMRIAVEAASSVRIRRFLVQEMVSGGIELILGARRDPLGTLILLGAGGVTAELYGDMALRILHGRSPLSEDEALEMAQELKSWPLLDGFRGRPKADVDALVSAIVRFSMMAASLGGRLLDAEINPIFVLPAGRGVCAADGVVILAK